MKRILLLVTVIIGMMAIGGGIAIARGGGGDDPKAQHITLYAIETFWADITAAGEVSTGEDEPTFDPGPGDMFTFTDTVYSDAERTNEIGTNTGSCLATEVRGEFPTEEPPPDAELPDFLIRNVCSGVLSLGDGDIAWQGRVDFSDELFSGPEPGPDTPFVTLALTGGTDAYQRAGGEVAVFDETDYSSEDNPTLNRYEITLYNLNAAPHKK